jgi:cobalt/nickel transport system permease protein
VLVKAAHAAQDTSDAMRCRGFEGSYDLQAAWRPRLSDALWASMLVAAIALFVVLQRQV